MASSTEVSDIEGRIEAVSLQNRTKQLPNTNKSKINQVRSWGRGRGNKFKGNILQDLLYTISKDRLPSHTSKWDITALESVARVFYDKKFLPVSTVLDMVYDKTGMFGPLTPKQKDSVKNVQDDLMFSFSILDVMMGHYNYCIEETIKGFKRDVEKQSQSLMQDFATSTVMLIHHARNRKSTGSIGRVSEQVFIDLFKTFVKMCSLIPSQGEEYKSSIEVLQHNITAIADVVLLAGDFFSLPSTVYPAVSVVSIVEVKNMTGSVSKKKHDSGYRKTKPVRIASHSDTCSSKGSETSSVSDNTSSFDSEKPLNEDPAIYSSVAQKVLAKHGAELFVHGTNLIYGEKFDSKNKECRLYPGMIVIGTQVIFTLLEYPLALLRGLHFDHDVLQQGKSYIYYSEPKDMLKKEDRDLLLESFVRLSNGKQ